MIQAEFKAVIQTMITKCENYFQNRLVAIYLNGSIHNNEAVMGVSDIDAWVIIGEKLNDIDKNWVEENEKHLDTNFDVVKGVHFNLTSISQFKENTFARFALKYNASLIYGKDIIKEIENAGAVKFLPNKAMAKGRLDFAIKCFEDALTGRCPACLDEIPTNTYFASRKFARYFIIVEGVYFLMSKGVFETYKKERVLEQLKMYATDYSEILDISHSVLENSIETNIKHTDYIQIIKPFVEWMFDEVQKA